MPSLLSYSRSERLEARQLERHFRGDRLDNVFVKHLEAVQGDERDVIIFSVGYGRDRHGVFTMNFGPLNKDGGQRRLNVAVTRARQRVEVVSSIRSHDFQLSEGASAGARMLRDYIAYAESGGRFHLPDAGADEPSEWPSPLEEEVAAAIRELGYEPVPSVGVGTFRLDIGVRSPSNRSRFLLGIECDGVGYARTPTARDRERLRHEVLDQLGWGPIHRIWSLDWVRNRAGEIDRLRTALHAAEHRGASLLSPSAQAELVPGGGANSNGGARERTQRVVHDLTTAATAAELPWTRSYLRANLGRHSSYSDFHESVNRKAQTEMLIELVRAEAPISIDYAIRRLAAAWGLQRTGHRIVAAGRQAISQAAGRGDVLVRGDFLWGPDQTLTHVRVPDPGDPATRREIEDIPPEEIDLTISRLRVKSVEVV